jgi:hypothetical protein
MAWQSANLLQNMPMWDEFETVLSFIMDYRASGSWGESAATFFATANEHVVLTSRLVVVFLYELTGKVNFTHLAIIGDAFILGAIILLGLSQETKRLGLICAAVASLLIFQMQHYENLFSSYASIDHFQIVLLTTGCLTLLVRGGRWPTLMAGLLATLAAFTLAHGVAVLAAGACILLVQRQKRTLYLWLGFASIVVALFLWRLGSYSTIPSPRIGFQGVKNFFVYWLTMMGGVPSLGNQQVALVSGGAGLLILGWLLVKRTFCKDPFLCAIALNSVIACVLISYGRVNSVGIPALSSRYMIQSALIWTAIALLVVKNLGTPRRVALGSGALIAVACLLNVASTLHFSREAYLFVQRRIDATRYYDEKNTFVGLRLPIFPKPLEADVILATAAREAIFRVQTAVSREVVAPQSFTLSPIIFHFDKLALASRNLHVRGWMLTREQISTDLVPHLLLQEGDKSFLFRGFTEKRADVTRANPGRTDTEDCGFYFVIPREKIPAGTYNLRAVLIGQRRVLYNETKEQIVIPASTPVL